MGANKESRILLLRLSPPSSTGDLRTLEPIIRLMGCAAPQQFQLPAVPGCGNAAAKMGHTITLRSSRPTGGRMWPTSALLKQRNGGRKRRTPGSPISLFALEARLKIYFRTRDNGIGNENRLWEQYGQI